MRAQAGRLPSPLLPRLATGLAGQALDRPLPIDKITQEKLRTSRCCCDVKHASHSGRAIYERSASRRPHGPSALVYRFAFRQLPDCPESHCGPDDLLCINRSEISTVEALLRIG